MQSSSSDKRQVRYITDSDSNYSTSNDSIETNALIQMQNNEILSRILTDRLYFIKDEISEITNQIDQRQKLKQSIDSEIDERVCEVQNVIYLLEFDLCNRVDRSRRRTMLERQIADLYKEKRQEKLSHWTDTVMLQRELRKAEKEERNAVLDLWMLQFIK